MIEELAKQRLGFDQLRPGQLSAVQALTDGRDVLAVLPTGGGKSAIYRRAIVLNSQQSAKEHVAALLASCDADTFIFLSPEQLTREETLQTLKRARPGLFVLRPSLAIGLLQASVLAIGIFDQIVVLAGYAPGSISVVMQLYLYAFRDFNFGLGMAASMLVTAGTLLVSLVYIKGVYREVSY